MQELIVLWLDPDNGMNLNVFKCDAYFFFFFLLQVKSFFFFFSHERIPSIIA